MEGMSKFRKVPALGELSADDKVEIKAKGLKAWLTKDERQDWDKAAEAAALMKMAGYEAKDIAKNLGVSLVDLERKVDLDKADSAVALEAMQGLLFHIRNGDKKMIEFFFKHRMGWSEKKEVSITGELGIRPIINIGLSNGKKVAINGVGESKLPDVECQSD